MDVERSSPTATGMDQKLWVHLSPVAALAMGCRLMGRRQCSGVGTVIYDYAP